MKKRINAKSACLEWQACSHVPPGDAVCRGEDVLGLDEGAAALVGPPLLALVISGGHEAWEQNNYQYV